MILPDVNVLIYSFRAEHPRHAEFRQWLTGVVSGPEAYGMADLVLTGFVRIVTHPRVFRNPSPLDSALSFVSVLKEQSGCVNISPGRRHWNIFTDLCRRTGARGNLVQDAYLAAMAIESGCEWITMDRDFARFPDLRWRHPFE